MVELDAVFETDGNAALPGPGDNLFHAVAVTSSRDHNSLSARPLSSASRTA